MDNDNCLLDSTNVEKLEKMERSPSAKVIDEMADTTEALTRIELDVACAVEKLSNLNVFMMNLATKEGDFEAVSSETMNFSIDIMDSALRFDFLSGILDSEIAELEKFLIILQSNIDDTKKLFHDNMDEPFVSMTEKLKDSEKSMMESKDQISEIRLQAAKFQSIMARFKGNKEYDFENHDIVKRNANNSKGSVQSAEQIRHYLKMLEKSLAREMELEKKLAESYKNEEELKHKLFSLEEMEHLLESEIIDALEDKFVAQNVAVVFVEQCRELCGKVQILNFKLHGITHRESILDKAKKKLILVDSKILSSKTNTEALEKQVKVFELRQLTPSDTSETSSLKHDGLQFESLELQTYVEDLKERLESAESRAKNSEAKCNSLEEAKEKLLGEISVLKVASEKLVSLEKQLEESEETLQHAVASADASQEKQFVFKSTISDMELTLKSWKSKFMQAESNAEIAENNCITLSEINQKLNEELTTLRGRLQKLEECFDHDKKTRLAVAKKIEVQNKMMANIVMQLALERQRLQNEISSLMLENKNLVTKLNHPQSKQVDPNLHSNGNSESSVPSKTKASESTKISCNSKANLESIRRIDAGVLSLKHIIVALIIIIMSAIAYVLLSENL